MAQQNINTVVITGNLTRDPELRNTPSGTPVCGLRVAVNSRRKEAGEWVDKANYFDVTVWGSHGENCATYLAKGRPVAIQGRLDWREWEAKDGSGKRQSVEIIAETVQFLSYNDDAQGAAPAAQPAPQQASPQAAQQPVAAPQPAPAQQAPLAAQAPAAGVQPVAPVAGQGDDDIPF
jgi:single-strand DNA-binding protein